MQLPIIVRSEGDLDVFSTVEAAVNSVEAIDVEDGLYERAWDSTGQPLVFEVVRATEERRFLPRRMTEQVSFRPAPDRSNDRDGLRQTIVDYFRKYANEDLSAKSFDEVIEAATRRYSD